MQAARTRALTEEEIATLNAVVSMLGVVQAEWQQGQEQDEDNSATIKKLLGMIFGSRTEKTRAVLDKMARKAGQTQSAQAENGEQEKKKRKPPRKGHGRNGAAAFTGAKKEHVEHPDFKRPAGKREEGQALSACRLQRPCLLQSDPKTLIRITGMAPLGATVYTTPVKLMGRVERMNLALDWSGNAPIQEEGGSIGKLYVGQRLPTKHLLPCPGTGSACP